MYGHGSNQIREYWRYKNSNWLGKVEKLSIIHIEVNGEVEISINFVLPQLRPRCPPCWTPHQSYSVINIHSSQSPNENARMCSAQITCQKKSHESTSQVNSLALRPFRKTCLGKNPLGSTCWRSIEKNLYNLLKKSLKLQYFSKPLYHGWFCERSSFPLLSAIQSTNHWKNWRIKRNIGISLTVHPTESAEKVRLLRVTGWLFLRLIRARREMSLVWLLGNLLWLRNNVF